jgi:hypothetical protein
MTWQARFIVINGGLRVECLDMAKQLRDMEAG